MFKAAIRLSQCLLLETEQEQNSLWEISIVHVERRQCS